MSDKTVQYGPFNPQEMDSIAKALQTKNIPFEIEKDEAAEKKFKAINYENVVVQTQFRTQQYMAQIFYITIARKDVERVAADLEKLGFSTQTSEQELDETLNTEERTREDVFNKAQIEQKNFKRRMMAWVLVLGMICLIIISWAISS